MLMGSMMVLSEEVPPGGCDEEDHITELELLKNVMEEENECKFSVEQFCIGNVLTSWERPHAKCSLSPTDTKSHWRILAITVSCYISSNCTCSSRTSRNGSLGYTTSTRRSE